MEPGAISRSEIKLLELEERLAGAEGDLVAKQVDRQFLLLKKRAQRAMDEGLDTGGYASAQLLLEAIDVARKIVVLERRSAGN